MRILVVDDEEMTLVALSKKLGEKNYDVITTSNGADALKIISEEKIDLIISDVMMPAVSGFSLMSMLKNFYFSKIPLILMSGYPMDKFVLKSHGLDASNFISKPIDYEELDSKINEVISHG